MGINKLRTVENIADVISTRTVNQIYSALIQSLVPRNSSGIMISKAGTLGTATYRWLHGYIKKVYIDTLSNADYVDSTGENLIFYSNGNVIFKLDSKNASTSIDGSAPETRGAVRSASSGTFSTTSTSLVDVTNLSVSINRYYGRPIFMALMPDGSSDSYVSGALGNISFIEATEIPGLLGGGEYSFGAGDSLTSENLFYPPSAFWTILLGDSSLIGPIAAGSILDTDGSVGVEPLQLKVQARYDANASSIPVSVRNCVLYAREI